MLKFVWDKKLLIIALILITMTFILAIFAPQIACNDPLALNPSDKFATPSEEYPLGTDQLGRCVFSRLVFGARYSLSIAIPTLFVLTLIGVSVGTMSALLGGSLERFVMMICDIFSAFPSMVIVISLVGVMGNTIQNMIIAVIISSSAYYIRMGRGYAKAESSKDYVVAARISGCSNGQIIFHHIIPNILPTFAIFASSGVASVILMVSGFSFLGVGLEVGIPEWGAMLTEAKMYLYSAPQLVIYPGMFILCATAGFIFLAEGLREELALEDTSV